MLTVRPEQNFNSWAEGRPGKSTTRNTEMIASAMGWVGTIGSIGAYLLLSRGRWHATSLRYSLLNFVAGVLAGIATALYCAWPS